MTKFILEKGTICDEIYVLSEEKFGKEPVYLPLSGMFSEKGLRYTYQEYLQHLETTKQFAEEHVIKHPKMIRAFEDFCRAGSSFVADVKNKL